MSEEEKKRIVRESDLFRLVIEPPRGPISGKVMITFKGSLYSPLIDDPGDPFSSRQQPPFVLDKERIARRFADSVRQELLAALEGI